MHFVRQSQYPFHGSGDYTDYPGEWDDKQAMAATVVRFTPASGDSAGDDLFWMYYRGADDLLSGAGVVSIGMMTADPLTFNGRNWDKRRDRNPVIEPDATGTAPVLGGDYNDMAAVVDATNGVIRLFVNIYGNPSGTNRLVQFSSTNGYDFTYAGEATLGGGNFGSTVGGLFYVGARLWALCGVSASNGGGSNRRLRYSDDHGSTWTNAATAISVASDQNAWNGFSLVVGRAFVSGDYVYAVQPGMRYLGLDGAGGAYADWPEAIGLWRKALADVGDGQPWEAYPRNPIMVRGPTEGGCWQLNVMLLNGVALGPYQTWAHPDWDNIGSANMIELRDTPYAGLGEGWSTKHQYTAQAINQLALQNWSLNPLPNGTYAIRHAATGRWLGVNGSGGAVLTQSDAPATLFHLSRRNDFTLIRRDTSSGDALRVADLSRNTLATFAAPGDTSDRTVEWHIEIIAPASLEVGETVTAFITSRHSSLSLVPRIEAVDSAVPVVQGPALYGSAEHVFEIIPVR